MADYPAAFGLLLFKEENMFKTALLAAAIMLGATSANAACPVLMFITSWCPYCSSLQAELTARGISYQTCDIDGNEDCKNTLINRTGSAGVPVTFVCRYRIDGDDPDSVEEALGGF